MSVIWIDPLKFASVGRTLGSTDVLTGGTASSSTLFVGTAAAAVNNVASYTGSNYYQASGAADSTHYWQYDLGAGNETMIGAWRNYWDGIQSVIQTFAIKASATGSFAGEEVTIVASGSFAQSSGAGWYQLSWADPDGTSTYRYWRIYSATCQNTSANGNRPVVIEFEAYAYS